MPRFKCYITLSLWKLGDQKVSLDECHRILDPSSLETGIIPALIRLVEAQFKSTCKSIVLCWPE